MNRRQCSSAMLLGVAFILPSCALADAPAPAAKSTPKPAAMMSAVKKPNGSGIDVQYAVDGSPQIGRNTAVTLRFDGVTDPAGGSVRFSADGGLVLTGATSVPLPAGATTTVVVQAAPSGEGIAYLNVFTTQNGVTSATSVPIRVGKSDPTLRSNGEVRKTPAGEAVISMPVR